MDICSIFTVVKKSIFDATVDNGHSIEDCSVFDSALEGYCIVLYDYQVDNLQKWVRENCKKVSDHIAKLIKKQDYTMSAGLIKTVLHTDSFTESFVHEAGSIQAFLDKWGGDTNEEIETPSGTEREPDEVADELLDALAEVEESDNLLLDESEDFIGEGSFIGEDEFIADEFAEDVDANASAEEEEVMSELEENSPEEDEVEESGLEESEPEEVAEGEPEDATPEEVVSNSEENVQGEDFEGLAESGSELEDVPEVEKRQDDTPGQVLNFGDYTQASYKELVSMAAYIKEAAEKLEADEVPTAEILKSSDKNDVLDYVDEYAPSVIKDFFMEFIRNAESEMDYVRVTKVLDQFCEYVEEREQKLMEVGNE